MKLVDAQKRLNGELYKVFEPCPAEHDNDYIFHMTFAIGGAGYESYKRLVFVLIEQKKYKDINDDVV